MQRLLVALGAFLLAAISASAQQLPTQNFSATQVSCGTTATLAAAARYRNAVTIKVPTSGSTVYIGPAGVTTTTGFSVDGGTAMTLQPYAGAVYCVVATGTQTVSVGQTF